MDYMAEMRKGFGYHLGFNIMANALVGVGVNNAMTKGQSLDERIQNYAKASLENPKNALGDGELSSKASKLDEASKLEMQNKIVQEIKAELANGYDKNNVFNALSYAATYASFNNKPNMILSQISRMNKQELQDMQEFFSKNVIWLGTPYAESELSELFLQEDISLSEFKAKYKEYSQKTTAYKNAHEYEFPRVEEFKDEDGNTHTMIRSSQMVEDYAKAQRQKEDEELEAKAKAQRQAEIERNNRMMMRKYNGAKSSEHENSVRSQIYQDAFWEFLKSQDASVLLAYMQKLNVRA